VKSPTAEPVAAEDVASDAVEVEGEDDATPSADEPTTERVESEGGVLKKLIPKDDDIIVVGKSQMFKVH
jgi:hypothetical protein